VLIADNRTLLAHMLYEVRGLKPAAASWNPAGVASDHYKLTTDLRPWIGRDAILIREDPIDEEFTRRFAASEQLATLRAPLPGGQSRTMNIYLLRDFKGY